LVELDASYIESSLGVNQGLSYDYILYRTAAGDITRATSTGGQLNTPVIIDVPDTANPDAHVVDGIFKNLALNFQFTSDLTDQWSIRVAGLANGFTQVYNIPGTAGRMNADGVTINRNRVRERNRELGNHFFQADAAGRFDFGATQLLFVGGLEYSIDITSQEFNRTATSLPAFNFFDPDYSVRVPDNFAPQNWDDVKVYQWAGFGMARLSLLNKRLMINAGARVLDFRQVATGSAVAGENVFIGETTTIPKWGAIFRITPDIGVFYGHGAGYQPSTQANPDGTILPPVEGVQDEFGLKLSFFEDRIQGSIAYFDLRRINILETDPDRPDFQIPVGEVTNTGWDASLAFAATKSLQLIGGVSSVDSKRTYSTDASTIGLALAGQPAYRWKLWARYKFSQGALDGLAFGVGTNYVAQRDIQFSSGTSAPIALPSWQIYDAMVSYKWNEHVRLQLNVNNLGDTLYYPSGNGNRFKVGSPRRVSFSMTYHF
jgi:iron complex outermembrane receptor protein